MNRRESQTSGSEVSAVMAEFAALQEEHLRNAEEGRLCDSAECWRRREVLFVRLREAIDEAMSMLDRTGGEAEEMGSGLTKLLRQEEELGRAVAALRENMERQLVALRGGRKTLSGYGRSQPGSFGPRFLSSRT